MPQVSLSLNIHWKQLREQKLALLEVMNELPRDHKHLEPLTGLIHFLDAVQDHAVDSSQFTEAQIFGKR